jgi:transcriptional regulator with XRE-family HTH domain
MSAPANPYDKFVSELRAVRLARNLSQEELAKRIRLSRAQYTAIENGRSVVNFAHLHNLSVVLGVRFCIGDPTSPLASRYSNDE